MYACDDSLICKIGDGGDDNTLKRQQSCPLELSSIGYQVIPSTLLTISRTYTFTAILSNGNKTSEATTTIVITEAPKPVIQLNVSTAHTKFYHFYYYFYLQVLPALPIINNDQRVSILSTVMSQEEFSRNLTEGQGRALYTWTVERGNVDINDVSVLASAKYDPLFFFKSIWRYVKLIMCFAIFSNGPNLIFRENALTETLYVIRLAVTYFINDTYSINGSSTVTLNINTPPTGGVFTV
jgi:hypothetical protein